MTADAEQRGIGEGDSAVPPEGLGHLAAALLGHADSGRSTARRTASCRCPYDELPVELPKVTTFTRPRRFAAGAGAGVRERRRVRSAAVPPGARPTRWTRSSIRRGISCASAIRRTPSCRSIRRGGLLDAGRLLQRRRRARDPAPAVLALLHARAARRRPGRLRRAVQAAADAGHGAQERRGDVEVEGQRRRSRRHARRSTAPTRCAST